MRLVRYTVDGGPGRAGLVEDGRVFELAGDVFGPWDRTGPSHALAEVTLQAPCRPTKIMAIGVNYRDHAEEMKHDLPAEPVLFMKAVSSLNRPGGAIVHPAICRRMDYEGELAVVIGRRARNVKKQEAMDYVLGLTCLNDVTARDLQAKDGQWIRAKGFDTFCPLGPAIETGLDPSNLAVETWLNGERKQASRTSFLIFGVPALIEFITAAMTLEPGDVIATGTPSGVGPMKPGDEVEVRIEGIGSLANPVVAA